MSVDSETIEYFDIPLKSLSHDNINYDLRECLGNNMSGALYLEFNLLGTIIRNKL